MNTGTPQVEDGFTRIANELLEALCRVRIPGEARQVLDSIIRLTYGYNKKADRIAMSQMSNLTGLDKRRVSRGVRKLQKMNLVRRTGSPKAYWYAVNKNYTLWKTGANGVNNFTAGINSGVNVVPMGVNNDTRKSTKTTPPKTIDINPKKEEKTIINIYKNVKNFLRKNRKKNFGRRGQSEPIPIGEILRAGQLIKNENGAGRPKPE